MEARLKIGSGVKNSFETYMEMMHEIECIQKKPYIIQIQGVY